MEIQRLLSDDPAKSSMIYLAIGVLSLVKAIAVRNDPDRFRRELLDAGLFIGIGLVLRKYSTIKAEKRREVTESLPNWLVEGGPSESGGIGTLVSERIGGEPESEPSIRERARSVIAD